MTTSQRAPMGRKTWRASRAIQAALADSLSPLEFGNIPDGFATLDSLLRTKQPSVFSGALTRAAVVTTFLAAVQTILVTTGYAVAGDGGHARYIRVNSQPTHSGWVQSADGAYWEISERVYYPEMFGTIAADGTGGGAALQACFDCFASGTAGAALDGTGTPPAVHLRARTYLITTTLTLPNAIGVTGQGRWSSIIKAAAGFTGIMMTDKGNASKITLENFQLFANDEAGVTDLLNLGAGASPWGTSGYAKGLLLRGGSSAVLSGTCGLRHVSNVISILDCHTQYTADGIVEGANTNVCWYDDISVLGATGTSLYTIGQATIGRFEVEAPGASSTGLYVSRDAHVGHMVYSQASAVANGNAIVIDSSALRFSMSAFTHFTSGGSTLTNVISDGRSGHAAWGQSTTTAATARKEGLISDNLHVGSQNVFVQGCKLQNFTLRLTNTAGTLQHRIGGTPAPTVAGDYQSQINAASVTLHDTPTGTDGSTALAFGGKISSVNTNRFILDTASQDSTDKDPILFANVVFNTTTTPLMVYPSVLSRDVNGTTRRRVEFAFYNSSTGAAVALNTSNIGAGTFIDVQFLGFFL